MMEAAESLFPPPEGAGPGYSVRLDSFEGPLDLLLHLIKKNEVNICDIPISEIARQYLEHLKLMKELNLEIAGEFLVMASTLLQIKSKMLLPVVQDEDGEEEEEDPRAELVRRLLEYQRYKEAAASLAGAELLGREVLARKFPSPDLEESPPEEEPLELDLFRLVEAFRGILARMPEERFHEVAAEPTVGIGERMTDILSLLLEKEMLAFEELFPLEFGREFLVVTFLAMLELCRMRSIRIVQQERYGTIWIMAAVAADAEGDDA